MPQDKDELLRELIEKYAKMYMKYAHGKGVPYDDAEDVVMDAFWSFYNSKHFGKLNEEETKAMLARIVRNKSIDFHRKNSHFDTVEFEDSVDELELVSRMAENDPLDEIISNENYKRIRECMDGMKDIWKDPATMYFIEARSYEEISSALEIRDDVCRSRISRARKYLREKLRDLWGSG